MLLQVYLFSPAGGKFSILSYISTKYSLVKNKILKFFKDNLYEYYKSLFNLNNLNTKVNPLQAKTTLIGLAVMGSPILDNGKVRTAFTTERMNQNEIIQSIEKYDDIVQKGTESCIKNGYNVCIKLRKPGDNPDIHSNVESDHFDIYIQNFNSKKNLDTIKAIFEKDYREHLDTLHNHSQDIIKKTHDLQHSINDMSSQHEGIYEYLYTFNNMASWDKAIEMMSNWSWFI